MTPDQLLQTVSAVLLRTPPPGLSRAYINGFLKRNRTGLLTVIRKQFDRMCRPDALIPTYEQKLGFAVLPPESTGQQAVFARDIGTNPTVFLAVKARCHPMDPVKARQYAVHSRRADEKTWRIHPGEEWHASEDEAITAFALAHAHEARWLTDEKAEDWTGVRDAPYVLAETLAVRVAKERQEELNEERKREERIRARQLEDHERQRGEQAARKTQTESRPEIRAELTPTQVEPAVASSPDTLTAPQPTVTAWGGTQGRPLPDESIQKGMRVVTFRGEHGVVDKVDVTVWTIAGMTSWGGQTTEKRQEKSFSFQVRLDSGRLDHQSHLIEELSRPKDVVPDLAITDSHTLISPAQAWGEVYAQFRTISHLQEKSDNARKPLIKAQYLEQSREARVRFDRMFRRFHEWRGQNPRAVIADFDPLVYRILTLEAGIRVDGWESEMRWLKAAPKDWRTRYQAGDSVIRPIHEQGGRILERRDRIASIDGTDALMASDGARIPLFQLRSAPDEVLEPPTYPEHRYLVEVAEDMLAPTTNYRGEPAKAYPERGAVARAVKAFLADHGVDVRTQVETGANMSGIVLKPPGDTFPSASVNLMNQLLPGIGADRDEARFHPNAKEGEAGDPMTDYYGRPSGIWLDPQQIAAFAPYLAKAFKDAGQALNRNGEAWLARAKGTAPASAGVPGHARNGATADQRHTAAEGCIDTAFTMPRYGSIRVVCGAKGRRDVWNNLWVAGARYGNNGGRWAKGMVPPAEVLEEVRKRGITSFGAVEHLSEPSEDLHLDPVIWEVIENGGLQSDLIQDIGEELRPKARAIAGFLRPDGLSWLSLARLHYHEPGVEVVNEYPDDAWKHPDVMYETPGSYAELVNFALDYSFPEVRDEHYEEETIERLCSCQRPISPPMRRAG